MFRPVLLAALCVATLSACTVEYSKITVAPVMAAVLSSMNKDRLTGSTQRIAVRTVTKGADGKLKEIIGAKCVLTSDELRAEVVTPQEVVVPTFKQRAEFPNRGLPSGLVADCTAGKLTGRGITVSGQKEAAVGTGAGIAGALITLAVTAAIASSSPWQYPNVMTVELK